jgi:hypothetical protein
MVPNARFLELLADIEPSPTTKSNASAAHNAVRDHLRIHDEFSDRWVSSFLSGSYARDTSIRPKTSSDGQERPDVDIIVVTSFTTADHPDDVLEELRAALEDGDDGYAVDRINNRSVRITTWQAEMDVVPVIETFGGYLIGDRESGTWQFTNPPEHNRWSSDQNGIFGGRFKPLVKLDKWWRRENPTSPRPKGFVLEVLTALHAPKNETHYGEAFAKMLEGIHAEYGFRASVDQKPFIRDPAVPANDILRRVTVPQWKEFIDKVRVHAGYARRAQDERDMEEATRLWRKVFGPRFKTTLNPAKAATASSYAAAPATGYAFPNAMATPPNKPRGFA